MFHYRFNQYKLLLYANQGRDLLMTSSHFTQLIRIDPLHCNVVRLLVSLDRNLGCHAALHQISFYSCHVPRLPYHRMHPALVTCLDEEIDIGLHKWYSHGHIPAIWKHELLVVPEFFNNTENIVL